MGFFKDTFSNFFALIFGLIGIGCIIFSFIAAFVTGVFGGTSPWIAFLFFFVPGLFLLAMSRAFAKRG
jgi:hypothetical protein